MSVPSIKPQTSTTTPSDKYYIVVAGQTYELTYTVGTNAPQACDEQFWIAAAATAKLAIETLKSKQPKASSIKLTADTLEAKDDKGAILVAVKGDTTDADYLKIFQGSSFKAAKGSSSINLTHAQIFARATTPLAAHEHIAPLPTAEAYAPTKAPKTPSVAKAKAKTPDTFDQDIIAFAKKGKYTSDGGSFKDQLIDQSKQILGHTLAFPDLAKDETHKEYFEKTLKGTPGCALIIVRREKGEFKVEKHTSGKVDLSKSFILYKQANGQYKSLDRSVLYTPQEDKNLAKVASGALTIKADKEGKVNVNNTGDCGPQSIAHAQIQLAKGTYEDKILGKVLEEKGQENRNLASSHMLRKLNILCEDRSFVPQLVEAWQAVLNDKAEKGRLEKMFSGSAVQVIEKFCRDFKEIDVRRFAIELYAQYIKQPAVYVDGPFFYALQEATGTPIVILEKNTNTGKTWIKSLYPQGIKLSDGKDALFIYYNGRNHYESLDRKFIPKDLCAKHDRDLTFNEFQEAQRQYLDNENTTNREKVSLTFFNIDEPERELIKEIRKEKINDDDWNHMAIKDRIHFNLSITLEQIENKRNKDRWEAQIGALATLVKNNNPNKAEKERISTLFRELKENNSHAYLALKQKAKANDDKDMGNFLKKLDGLTGPRALAEIKETVSNTTIRDNGTKLVFNPTVVFNNFCTMNLNDLNRTSFVPIYVEFLKTHCPEDYGDLEKIIAPKDIGDEIPKMDALRFSILVRDLKRVRSLRQFLKVLNTTPRPSEATIFAAYTNLENENYGEYAKIWTLLKLEWNAGDAEIAKALLANQDAINEEFE